MKKTDAEAFACKYAGFETPPTRRDHLENRERCDIYSAILEGYEKAEEDLAPIIQASKHLAERVNQYLRQGCSRAELKAANDALKELLQ